VVASSLLQNGYKLVYWPNAKVVHSHAFNVYTQYKRYCDLGFVSTQYKRILINDTSLDEGKRLLLDILYHLIEQHHFREVIETVIDFIIRRLAFYVGARECRRKDCYV
jgi:hypothetical protein